MLLTYRISSKNAEITSWACRLLIRLHLLDIKSSTRSSSQLSLQWLRLQISRISLQTSSSSRYFYSYQRSEESKIARESILYASFISALRFLISNISKWRIESSNCKYHCSCLNARLRIEIRERFHLFFCVLTTNEHRMHAQRFAKENALSSYEMTRYSRKSHVLIILSLSFKRELSSRIVLQKSSSSSSSSSSQIAVRLNDYRVRYERYTSTNKSSTSRISSTDRRRRSNELIASKRSWERTKDNVTSVHRIQHLS